MAKTDATGELRKQPLPTDLFKTRQLVEQASLSPLPYYGCGASPLTPRGHIVGFVMLALASSTVPHTHEDLICLDLKRIFPPLQRIPRTFHGEAWSKGQANLTRLDKANGYL